MLHYNNDITEVVYSTLIVQTITTVTLDQIIMNTKGSYNWQNEFTVNQWLMEMDSHCIQRFYPSLQL